MPAYDCIVLGAGGFGSAAFFHLARAGRRVLAIDRFGKAHDRGSSHGETRIIRKAYIEHPDYVPLVVSAYDLWRELEAEAGQTLLHQVGLVLTGAPASEIVTGTKLARDRYRLHIEHVSHPEAARRFPGFRFRPDDEIHFDHDGGYLAVESCVRAHLDGGERAGGELRLNETIRGWRSNGRTATVETDAGVYEAASLVVTAGAWAAALLADLRIPLQVLRKPLLWHPVDPAHARERKASPCFCFETPDGFFYGFPSLDGTVVKVAEHTGGEPVSDPLAVDRTLRPGDVSRIARFLREHLDGVSEVPARHAVCLYTMTPDVNFIVDRHPEYSNVALGAGFSGHGFKFTSSLGQALAELATDGRTRHPIGFLSLSRPALRAPRA